MQPEWLDDAVPVLKERARSTLADSRRARYLYRRKQLV